MEVKQTVWPDHCIQGTWDSELVTGLRFEEGKHHKVLKGTYSDVGVVSRKCFGRGLLGVWFCW